MFSLQVKFHLNNVFEIISVDNVNDPNVSTTRPDIDILDGESEANFTDTYGKLMLLEC